MSVYVWGRGDGMGDKELETCAVRTVYTAKQIKWIDLLYQNIQEQTSFFHTGKRKVTLTTTTNGGIRGAPLM